MDLIWTKAFHKVIRLSNEAIIDGVLIQYGRDTPRPTAQEECHMMLKAKICKPRNTKDPQQATGSQGGCPEQIRFSLTVLRVKHCC